MVKRNKDKVNKEAFGKSIGAFGGIFAGIVKKGAKANARNVKQLGRTEARILRRGKGGKSKNYR